MHLDRAMVPVQLSCKSHALACSEVHVQTCLYTLCLASCSFYQGRISSVTLRAGSVQRPISSGSYPISSFTGCLPSWWYLHPAREPPQATQTRLCGGRRDLSLGSQTSVVVLQHADYCSLPRLGGDTVLERSGWSMAARSYVATDEERHFDQAACAWSDRCGARAARGVLAATCSAGHEFPTRAVGVF